MNTFVEMYQKGYSLDQVAEHHNTTRAIVRRRVLRAGAMRSRSEATKLAYNAGRRVAFRAQNRRGKNNPAWKGGRLHQDGYIKIWMPDHPHADNKGYMFEHRVVAEQLVGRTLTSREDVHHIDGVRNNNELANLLIVTKQEHSTIHSRQNKIKRWVKSETYRVILQHAEEIRNLRSLGLSYQKIADHLGLNINAVRHASRKNLNPSPLG